MEAQKVTPEKPDAHEVPESTMRKHIADFNNYNELLDKNSVVPAPHAPHQLPLGQLPSKRRSRPFPVNPFDYGVLIQVTPKPTTPSRTR